MSFEYYDIIGTRNGAPARKKYIYHAKRQQNLVMDRSFRNSNQVNKHAFSFRDSRENPAFGAG